MDVIKLPLVLFILGSFIFFTFVFRDTTAKVDVTGAEVLAQIAQQEADMAATRNGGKPVPELAARAKSLRERADKITAEAAEKKVKRDTALERLEGWFADIIGTGS